MSATEDQMFDDLESLWNSDTVPNVFEILKKTDNVPEEAIVEMFQIDLEHRWRHSDSTIRVDASFYTSNESGHKLSPKGIVELLGWEFRVRNQWGDCVSRSALLEREPDHLAILEQQLDVVSASMRWPRIIFRVDQDAKTEFDFDRETVAGRRHAAESGMKYHVTSATQHRILLCDAHDTSISRNQLRLVRDSQKSVLVNNSSKNRAFAIVNDRVLIPGATESIGLPLTLSLGNRRTIEISQR